MYNDLSKGTKNVGKEMKKVSQGRVRDRGKTWFPELSDKREQRAYPAESCMDVWRGCATPTESVQTLGSPGGGGHFE